MAITKRTRFEVLRRDKHTCQYCGEKAPDVILHIDHVVPRALGGDDKPGNLVAACKDCNSGKTSIAPDAPIVRGLTEQAAAYVLGMQDKMTRFRADVESLDDYVYLFREEWDVWNNSGDRLPLPADFEMTLFRWKQMGIPSKVYDLAIPVAMNNNRVRPDDKFSYMCGIVWNLINQREIDYSVTDETAAVYTSAEADEFASQEYGAGRRTEGNRIMTIITGRGYSPAQDFVRNHVDGTTNEIIDQFREGGIAPWQETEPVSA
jgi:hypothetical protein